MRLWAHPRACGEYTDSTVYTFHQVGSPPRMRGLCRFLCRLSRPVRLTPAHAGTISLWIFSERPLGAHPRVCGEDTDWVCPLGAIAGSPPRIRGLYQRVRAVSDHVGLTPAHAGKIGSVRRGVRRDQAHPRACGEDKGDTAWRCRKRGSPPHMRGRYGGIAGKSISHGLTPARAKTIV